MPDSQAERSRFSDLIFKWLNGRIAVPMICEAGKMKSEKFLEEVRQINVVHGLL